MSAGVPASGAPPPPLHSSLDVPSLTAGTNSWLNIQPLLRHSFLHLHDHIIHLNHTTDRQTREISYLHEQNKANMDAITSHFNSAIASQQKRHEGEMEEMRQSLWRVEKLVENGERDRSVAEVKIRESLGQLDSKVRSGGVEGMKPVTDKVLQMDSNHLGLSMRLDGLAEVVDKHLFKSKGRAGERPGADVDNKNVLQLISDVGKIRDELAFKCDGAFVKTTLDGKANKQSVADALHGKANKKTIARELAEMKGLLIGELKKVRVQIDSVGSTNGLPVTKISSTLMAVAKEVRDGVGESREAMNMLEGRINNLENATGGVPGGAGWGMGEMGYRHRAAPSAADVRGSSRGGNGDENENENENENVNVLRNSVGELESRIDEMRKSVGGYK